CSLLSPPSLSPCPDELLRSLAGPPSPPAPAPPGWRVPVDCVRANELCAGEPSCSSRYRTLRQCLAGRDRNTMLANKECQAALEVLQESPLYECRCKRGMKKELQCLQIYWSIHMGLTEGTGGSHGETWGMLRAGSGALGSGGDKFSWLNSSRFLWGIDVPSPWIWEERGKMLSESFIPLPWRGWGRSRVFLDFCHSHPGAEVWLLSFQKKKKKKSWKSFSGLCARQIPFQELRICSGNGREMGAPRASHPTPKKPQKSPKVRSFPWAESRLADFHTNCQATFQSLTNCPGDNFQACLGSYVGLIGECSGSGSGNGFSRWDFIPIPSSPPGFDITPNYVDASTTSITISPWCSCKGSGNMEEECEKFLRDFTENPCLRKAL
ncbi:GFRA2 protein, partial [Acrocephalus arundinaceus]|nr:GFRA2 protein [Acrocephalus arundinaceus]